MSQAHEPTFAVGSASASHAARSASGPVVVLSAEQFAAQQLARELQEMRESGIKLDETVPGGKYGTAGVPGHFHDAHGQAFNAKTARETAESVARLAAAPGSGQQVLGQSAAGIEAGRAGFADSAGNVEGAVNTDLTGVHPDQNIPDGISPRGVQKKATRKRASKSKE